MEPHVEVAGIKRDLPSLVDTVLFRVVQEAVTNIVEHARATKANIRLQFNEGSVAACIEDDGKGFDPKESNLGARAFGLLGMQERVSLFSGAFRIESQPGQGTRVALEIPTTAE